MRLPNASALIAAVTLAVTLTAAPAAAGAQFTVYTSRAAFLAATSRAATDSFDDLAFGVASSPLARSAGAFAYAVSASTTDLYVTGAGADAWLSANTATDVLTFDGFGPSVRGVGGFFFGTDLDGAFRPGTSVTLQATGLAGTTTYTLAGATLGSFLGFVSTDAVTSLTVSAVIPPDDLAWPTVNGLVLAEAATATPEPTTLVVVGTGLAALALVAAGRRRA